MEELHAPADPGDTLLELPSNMEADPIRERDRARVHAALFGDGRGPEVRADAPRFGRYAVREKIGEGAMGEVYLAVDPLLERDVAIKVVHRRLAGRGDRGVPRLLQEARSMAKLRHPNVVGVYEAGIDDGVAWIAMEYVQGHSLRTWLQAEPRSVAAILRCLVDAGRGLSAAHAAGLVHRDFKPDNVLVDRDGRARVSDFGLVRAFQESAEGSQPTSDAEASASAKPASGGSLTRDGAILGTPAYMPPEQLAGDPVDASCDQFAFCVTAWEALYGVRPFSGDDPITLCGAILAGNLRKRRPTSGVSRAIERALRRGLSARAKARHPSMDELLLRLEPKRGTVIMGAATLAMLSAVGVGRVFIGDDPGITCSDAQRELEGVWDEAAGDTLVETMVSSGLPYAEATALSVRRELDDRSATWLDAWTRTCEARVRGLESSTQIDRRVACLNARRADTTALVRRFSTADAAILSNAQDAVLQLPRVSMCDRLDEDSVLADAAVRERLDPVLSTARSLRLVGQAAAGLGPALAAEIAAEQLGASDYVAQARRELGEIRLAVGDYPGAATTWQRAVDAAVVADDEAGQVEAWFDLAELAANEQRNVERAREWLGHGEAVMARLPESATLSLRRDLAAAQVYAIEDPKLALAMAEAIIAGADADDPDQVAVRDEAAHMRCPLLLDLARWDEAEAAYRARIEEDTERYGAEHPNTGAGWFGLGIALDRHGKVDGAEGAKTAYLNAKYIWRTAWPNGHRDVGTVEIALANLAQRSGDWELADAHVEEAMSVYRNSLQDGDIAFAEAWTAKGVVQHRRQQFSQAAESHDAAQRVYEMSESDRSLYIALARSNAAEARLRAGADGLEDELQEVYDIVRKVAGDASPYLGYPAKGRALLALKRREFSQACSLARSATVLCSVDQVECADVMGLVATSCYGSTSHDH